MNMLTPVHGLLGAQPRPDLTVLLQPLIPGLRRFAVRLTRDSDDGEDLLQDVLLKVIAQPQRMQRVQALQPWLIRVMYHQFIDACRRNAPLRNARSLAAYGEIEDAGSIDGAWAPADQHDEDAPERHLQRAQLQSTVRNAIRALPVIQQRLVALHELQGLSVLDIAAELGMPVNTVKSALSRARTRLRQSLTAAGEHQPAAQALAPPPHRRRAKRGIGPSCVPHRARASAL